MTYLFVQVTCRNQWHSTCFVTYLFVQVTYRNQWHSTYVDQVWWWYVKVFMSYAWQNGQTNRQTDERTIGDCALAKICHSFWPPDLVIRSLTLKNFNRYQTTYVDKFWLRLVKSCDLYRVERNIQWNIEDWLCRHPVTSLATFSLRNTFVLGNSNMTFPFQMSN